MYKKEIGKTLRSFRRKKGLTQEEVAKRINTTKQCISSWESDRTQPDNDMLDALASIYGCTSDALLGEYGAMGRFVFSSAESRIDMIKGYYRMKEVEAVADAYDRSSDAEKEIICRILGINREIFNIQNLIDQEEK